jgi:hypothetical protein
MIREVYSGSRIPNPGFFPIPDPGSKNHRIPDSQHYLKVNGSRFPDLTVVNTSAVCPEEGWSRDGSARSAHPSASSALASAAGRLTGAPGQRRHLESSLLLLSSIVCHMRPMLLKNGHVEVTKQRFKKCK